MANGKINIDVNLRANTSLLDGPLKASLHNLKNLSLDNLINVRDVLKATQDLDKAKITAEKVQLALLNSFNSKLNTYDIEKLRKELSLIDGGLNGIKNDFSAVGAQGQAAFRNLASAVTSTKLPLQETHSLLKSMGTTLTNTIKWSIASSALNGVTGSILKAWSFTQLLDRSLNDIMIVTGKSSEEMEKFAKYANNASKALGATTRDYTNAALIYYQQGLGEGDVLARSNVTVKAANVTQLSTQLVSELLTAVWNGYKVSAQEAELYIDKVAKVAASTAADLEELSDGMSKVASAAATMGVDIDLLNAQLATIVSVTRQDSSVVGTALKTIYARMGDLMVEGEDEFGTKLGQVSSDLQTMGISILDAQGQMRDMGAVIEEVASKWGTWTDAQQLAAAVAIAGKRLLKDWRSYTVMYNVA